MRLRPVGLVYLFAVFGGVFFVVGLIGLIWGRGDRGAIGMATGVSCLVLAALVWRICCRR